MSQNQASGKRTFLGLTHNPFVPPKDGFFSGADRKTHLEHLRHLSQWSRRILVVSGPFGIGKSTLFRELSANLEPHTKAARLAGMVVTTEREVLAALLQGFGVAADTSANADDLSRIISKFVDEQNEGGRSCMVMVDDGHLLEPTALQRLIALVADSSLRMVVFAETTVIGAIDRDTKAAALEWFEIRLTGFPKSDVRDYLEWRFSQAQYRGLLPFTDEQLENIVTKSSGNPGIVDSLASNLLIEMETGQIRNRGGFPFMHAILAVLLVAFVGLLYVWFAQPQEDESDVQVAVITAADSAESTKANASGESDQPRATNHAAPIAETQETTQNDAPGTLVTSDAPSANASSTSQTSDAGGSNGQPKDAQNAGRDTNEQTPNEGWVDQDAWIAEEFGAGNQAGGVQVPTPDDAGTDKSATDKPAQVATDQSATEQSTAKQSATSSPAAQPQSQQEPRQESPIPVAEASDSAPALAPSALNSSGIKNAQWILAQDARRFTVQLVTVSKPERARELILKQDEPGDFAVYQINRDGRRLNVIVYGVFSDGKAANAALSQLKAELAGVKPWVRPLNLVQDAVRGGL